MLLNRKSVNAKKTAFCSMTVALGMVLLYLCSTLPTLKLSCLAAASVILGVTVMKYGARSAALCFIATSLLGILLPDKLMLIYYVAFFGSYVIIKRVIEKIGSIITEWGVKVIWFLILGVIAGKITGIAQFPPYFYIPAILGFCITFDVFFSIAMTYVKQRFGKFLMR